MPPATSQAPVELQREADACLARAAARLGHALRNPLTTIRAGTQLARRAMPADAPAAAFLEGVEEEALALERLARGMEALVALQPMELAPLDLGELACRAADEARVAAEAREIELSCSGLRGLKARSAAPLVSAALREVLDNAVRYGSCGSRVELKGRRRGGQVFVEICDGGGGLAPRAEQRLFEPFASTSGRPGLGLCRARRAALLAGGSLTLLRSSGEGCCFELALPGAEV